MTANQHFKRIVAIIIVILFHFMWSHNAEAEELSTEMKGYLSAESGLLDRSTYVDGAQFSNMVPDVHTMRIGLRYEDTASYEAIFENLSGDGFAFGYYDSNRHFVETGRCRDSEIMVIGYGELPVWHILLNDRFENLEEAEDTAELCNGEVIQLEGNIRVFFGDFQKWDDAFIEIQKNKLGARPFTDITPALRVVSALDFKILFRLNDAYSELAVLPLSDVGNALTVFRDEVYHGGFAVRLFENDRLTVINCVELEDYVKGVIPYEMDPRWPLEALRAQAICARTYGVYNQEAYAKYGFDLTDNTESQVYKGCRGATTTTDFAAESTAGKLIWFQGNVCEIYYFAADGGSTEDGLFVFDTDRPYLTGKYDPFELMIEYPLRNWEVRYSGSALSYMLMRDGYDIGPIVSLTPEYSDTGNVIAISFLDTQGTSLRLLGRPCYTSLRLSSCHFSVSKDGDDFIFSGSGLGHSCGMSQWGAYSMALNYGYSCEDIIRFYYTGVYIA